MIIVWMLLFITTVQVPETIHGEGSWTVNILLYLCWLDLPSNDQVASPLLCWATLPRNDII